MIFHRLKDRVIAKTANACFATGFAKQGFHIVHVINVQYQAATGRGVIPADIVLNINAWFPVVAIKVNMTASTVLLTPACMSAVPRCGKDIVCIALNINV